MRQRRNSVQLHECFSYQQAKNRYQKDCPSDILAPPGDGGKNLCFTFNIDLLDRNSAQYLISDLRIT